MRTELATTPRPRTATHSHLLHRHINGGNSNLEMSDIDAKNAAPILDIRNMKTFGELVTALGDMFQDGSNHLKPALQHEIARHPHRDNPLYYALLLRVFAMVAEFGFEFCRHHIKACASFFEAHPDIQRHDPFNIKILLSLATYMGNLNVQMRAFRNQLLEMHWDRPDHISTTPTKLISQTLQFYVPPQKGTITCSYLPEFPELMRAQRIRQVLLIPDTDFHLIMKELTLHPENSQHPLYGPVVLERMARATPDDILSMQDQLARAFPWMDMDMFMELVRAEG